MVENPHAAAPDEDPTEHIGPKIPDPWDDPDQADWASTARDLDEVSS